MVRQIYEEMHSETRNPLRLLSQAVSLCAQLGDHVQQNPSDRAKEWFRTTLWKMTGFIQQHYDTKITLEDVAASGGRVPKQMLRIVQ
ncbi:hypothetical protein AWM70_08775 [Paenibacillus yonginensis]|uniref:Uncharacterized protein n=1 Tax=Paenibacillus yonginensis TaxID=1462996 RepID=A0A1B1MZS2_9BACL|nr:hypothetical protein [Paenibacillus yonginensis]ANS74668.1 hypothetical protein AWM70_08775 [Paenibacillus yonginensis]